MVKSNQDNPEKFYDSHIPESMNVNEPQSAYYAMDVAHHEIPNHILEDIRISEREYAEGLAIPVGNFMARLRRGL